MYKPSYISGFKFGTSMKQQRKHPIKLHLKNRLIFFLFLVGHFHLNAFAQILEGTYLATISQRSYSIKHYKKHIGFE